MTSPSDETSPEAILRTTPAPDDAGAETADRYEWQAMMATADVLALYFESLDDGGNLVAGADFTVICEHHEDWAVITGGQSEIVSGKHREASVGPYGTFRQLLNDGGVLHLFNRWRSLQQTPMCRLVTSAGLRDDGAKTARACQRLRDDPDAQDPEVLAVVADLRTAIAALLAPNGTAPSPEPDAVIRAFMRSLRFQEGQARRDQVPDMAGERYGRPVAERLGQPQGGGAVWRAVLAIVRPRMRAGGPSTGGALPTVLGVEHDDLFARRTLTLSDIDTAARFAMANIAGYAPLRRIIKANRMAVKMTHGGCSDNAIQRADDLRLQYRQYWRGRRSNPNTSDQRRQLDNTLSRLIDETTHTVRADGVTWGAQLWRELGERFQSLEGQPEAQGLSADLLLGGVSDLANNCRAWYTDRFDAPARLRQLIAEEAAS
jgi:hypothetical protein